MPVPVRLYRFGVYEVDGARKELRKFGIRLKLERKPFQLLIALLDRSGQVVTRRDLQVLLWGEGVFVDFDKGVSVAVTKLRAALNDSSENPKYIETVAGEGYRFIATVEKILAVNPVPIPAQLKVEHLPELPAPAIAPSSAPSEPISLVRRTWVQAHPAILFAALLVGIVLLGVRGSSLNRRKLHGQAHAGKVMLVVLPFENLSGDPSQEYLSDGITEELSEQLGNLNPRRLGVIGRTSAMTYKQSRRTISQIGKELGVGYVLEGSVRRSGKKLRVTAQLVEVSDQAHVWAADYDSDIRDLVEVEDDIAHQITGQVGVSIAIGGVEKLNHHSPNPEAHEAYLLGRYCWNKRTSAGQGMAEQHFRRAVQLDPQYAAAYAGLAECGPRGEAKAAALKAVELDPSSGEARTALGFVELFRELDLPAAERELKTAIQLDPNYATAHHWYAFVLEARGRLPEAVAEITEAAKLDPLSLIVRSAMAGGLSELGKQDAAQAQLKIVFDLDPHFPKAHETLGMIYMEKGMYKEAIREFHTAEHYGGYKLSGVVGYASARMGNRKTALRLVEELEVLERNSGSGGAAEDLAYIEMGLGDRDKALKWLQKEFADHNDDGLMQLKADPIFAPLRSDPRFQDLLNRMKLS